MLLPLVGRVTIPPRVSKSPSIVDAVKGRASTCSTKKHRLRTWFWARLSPGCCSLYETFYVKAQRRYEVANLWKSSCQLNCVLECPDGPHQPTNSLMLLAKHISSFLQECLCQHEVGVVMISRQSAIHTRLNLVLSQVNLRTVDRGWSGHHWFGILLIFLFVMLKQSKWTKILGASKAS